VIEAERAEFLELLKAVREDCERILERLERVEAPWPALRVVGDESGTASPAAP
jgi:hypothetical protein